jgi:hypothetical protein
MELLLALAAVIVAAATLFLAYAARSRFNAQEGRLNKTEQHLAGLTSGQQELKSAAAEGQTAAQDVQQVRKAVQELADLRETERQNQANDVTKTVGQLRAQVTAAFKDQGTRLDSLIQLTADHDSRLNSLDQLAPDGARSLANLAADAARLKEEASRQAAALRALSDGTTSASERTAEILAGLSDQVLALAADVGLLDLDRRELRTQLRKWLAHCAQQTRMAPATRVMPGFIQAERRAASHILPCLYENLLQAANLDAVFREQAGPAGVFYYLVSRSPDGQPAEQQLGSLLTACQIPDSGSEWPGLAELRSLLLAMYVGGPATMRIGPLVVSHAAGDMFRGTVLTAGEAQSLDADDPTPSSIRYSRMLGELPADCVLDLAAWAASNSSSC